MLSFRSDPGNIVLFSILFSTNHSLMIALCSRPSHFWASRFRTISLVGLPKTDILSL